jgi:hypothetical protein
MPLAQQVFFVAGVCEEVEIIEVEEPDFPCFQGDGLASDGLFNGLNVSSTFIIRTADDFTVPNGERFTTQQVRINVFSPSDILEVTLNFRADDNGLPGIILETVTMAPSSFRVLGEDTSGRFQYELTFDLATPIEFTEGTYWLSPIVRSVNNDFFILWEASTTGTSGANTVLSENDGQTWVTFVPHYQQVFFVAGECEVVDGCLDAPFGQYPTQSYTPQCWGFQENIGEGQFGQYSVVNLTSGTAYTFSTDIPSAFITISDVDGTNVLASGTGAATWTATTTGPVRFYTHEDEECLSSINSVTRMVQCGEVIPRVCEDFVVDSNNLENGILFGGNTSQRLALDIPVADTGFTLYGMEPTVLDEATEFTFIFYENQAGLPGQQIATRTGIILGAEVTGNNFGYDFIKYKVGFDSPIDFAANTTYWIEIQSDARAWEYSTDQSSNIGNLDVHKENGADWTPITGIPNLVFNLICGELSVNDITNFDFSYYPNPVKDILHISTQKQVESVSVFNLLGQQIILNEKVENNQIHLKSLSNGIYVFRVVLISGQIGTFKIIKK